MGLFGKLFGRSQMDDFEEWAKNASSEELSAELEKNRQRYQETGDYGPTEDILVREQTKRVNEELDNDPYLNTNPNYRWTDKNRWE